MESSGLRLMHLIDTRMCAIAKAEQGNADRMCLYGTGEYWSAFDHSAYQLMKIFPDLSPFVVNHPAYPFTVVGVNVSDRQLRNYERRHGCNTRREDYMEFSVTPSDKSCYADWHRQEIEELNEDSE